MRAFSKFWCLAEKALQVFEVGAGVRDLLGDALARVVGIEPVAVLANARDVAEIKLGEVLEGADGVGDGAAGEIVVEATAGAVLLDVGHNLEKRAVAWRRGSRRRRGRCRGRVTGTSRTACRSGSTGTTASGGCGSPPLVPSAAERPYFRLPGRSQVPYGLSSSRLCASWLDSGYRSRTGPSVRRNQGGARSPRRVPAAGFESMCGMAAAFPVPGAL